MRWGIKYCLVFIVGLLYGYFFGDPHIGSAILGTISGMIIMLPREESK